MERDPFFFVVPYMERPSPAVPPQRNESVADNPIESLCSFVVLFFFGQGVTGVLPGFLPWPFGAQQSLLPYYETPCFHWAPGSLGY